MSAETTLLEARGMHKTYGPVVALASASLAVEHGEVHALLGANGAGKSTLVKLLTGVVKPDEGEIRVGGREVRVGSPVEAAKLGLAPVFQDPALVPDLTVAQNLRLTRSSVAAVRGRLREMELEVDFSERAGDVALPLLRMVDLARALARDPQLLVLDEITAALPSDLAERVFAVMRAWRERGRSVLFITHRLAEVIAACDRATILRDGADVATMVPRDGGETAIVAHMLGPEAARAEEEAVAREDVAPKRLEGEVALDVASLQIGRVVEVSFSLRRGEILGIAALEGQGQDELFAALSGQQRPDRGEIRAGDEVLRARTPYDAIRHGLVLVPADRLLAL